MEGRKKRHWCNQHASITFVTVLYPHASAPLTSFYPHARRLFPFVRTRGVCKDNKEVSLDRATEMFIVLEALITSGKTGQSRVVRRPREWRLSPNIRRVPYIDVRSEHGGQGWRTTTLFSCNQ